jgi:hypothetical protein
MFEYILNQNFHGCLLKVIWKFPKSDLVKQVCFFRNEREVSIL